MKLEKIVCGKWYYYVRFCDYSYDFKIRFKRVFKIECNSDGRSTIYFGLPGEYDKVTPDLSLILQKKLFTLYVMLPETQSGIS